MVLHDERNGSKQRHMRAAEESIAHTVDRVRGRGKDVSSSLSLANHQAVTHTDAPTGSTMLGTTMKRLSLAIALLACFGLWNWALTRCLACRFPPCRMSPSSV